MRSRYITKKRNFIRKYTLAFTLVLILCSVVIPVSSYAYDEVTEVSVTVGFWGDEEYVKDEVSLSAIANACGTHREIYTWISNGSTPGTTEAEGIYILDMLDYFGVDTGSVECLNFYTRDASTYSGSTQQWTTGQLFGSRYSYADCFMMALEDYNEDREDYMKNPERHYTINDIYDFTNKKYTSEAWNNRYRVEPMIALRTKSSSWKGYTPASNLDFSGMTSNGKPILIFGQAGRNDITRNLMAQMITKIHVWYEGSPGIKLESEETEGKVGDEKTYTLVISTPDDFLSQKIADKIKIESTDDSIVKVKDNGVVEITGEGSADITATYNGKVYSRLTVTGNIDAKDDGEGNGSGSGSSEGSGNGSSSGANTGTGAGTGSDTNNSQGSGSSTSSHKSPDSTKTASGVSLKTDNRLLEAQEQGSAGGAASGSGDNKVKVYTISEADGVYVGREQNYHIMLILLLLGILAAGLGTIAEVLYFRSQVFWIEKAKRIYERS